MRTLSYNNRSDFDAIIHNLRQNFSGRELRFIVPSRKDKRLMPGHNELITWTWQDVYENIVPPGNRRRTLSPPDHLLILRKILADSIHNHSDKIKSLPGVERAGFLSVLSSDIRELLNEGVNPEQLIANNESDNPAEFLLPEIYTEYMKYLETFGLLDSAQVYSEAHKAILDNQEWGKGLVIIFAGFLSFTHAQLELVKAIRDRCYDTIVIKPEANMRGFHDAGQQLGEQEKASPSAGRIIEISSAEPGLEPEIIARTLALWSAGHFEAAGEFPGFGKIGLMIDEGREESFSESFARYGVPCTFRDGVTISRTLPGKILSALRHLNARQFPTYDTAILWTQPCFAGSKFPVMAAYRSGRSGIDDWEKYLSENSDDPTFHTAMIAANAVKKFCAFLDVNHTPSQIMNEFNDFLHTPGIWLEREDNISPFPELDESMRMTASAIETVSEKVTALRELLPDLGRANDEKLKGDDAYNFIEDWCRNSHIRAPLQMSNSVQIFAGRPPVLTSFPVWIMSGVTQKTWSQSQKASPLLGNEERLRLNENGAYLPRTKEKAEQNEAVFRRLIMTGETLTIISRPLLDDEGRPVSSSPFMKKFLDDMPGWKMKQKASEGIKILLGSDGFTFPEIDAGENIPRCTPCVKSHASSVNASDIQELLECPFLWYQKRKAGLFQPDLELVSPAQWGNLLHKYWESVWKIYRQDMAAKGMHFVSTAKSEWEKLSAAEDPYSEFSSLLRDSRLKRKLETLKFRAERLALLQGEILDTLHKDYRHESILLEDEAHLEYEVDSVKFFGKCDRIEILQGIDGSQIAFIADYKEGRKPSKKYDDGMNIESKFWRREDEPEAFKHGLQLSLYSAMFREKYGYDVSGVYILGHEDGRVWGTFTQDTAKIFRSFTPFDDDGKNIAPDTDIAGRVSEGQYAMKCAVRILDGGEFMPDYDSDKCRNCGITSICRKGEFRGEITDEGESD